MSSWRLWLGIVLLGALIWWSYPHRSAKRLGADTEVTIWFNGIIEGRHLEVVDAFERTFDHRTPYSGIYRAEVGSSAVRGGLEGEGNPQRLMCGIAGGVPPDVVEYDRMAICQWAARGAFMDLTPFIQKDAHELAEERDKLAALKQAGAPPDRIARQQRRVDWLASFAVRKSDYYPAPWKECKYQGGLYGIPHTMDDRVLYYSDDMLIRAGLVDKTGKPQPPRTWEQVLTKRVDARDATIRGDTVDIPSVDLEAAGVQPGDTLVQITTGGLVNRCLVAAVDSPHRIVVRTAYPDKPLLLGDGAGQHVKVISRDSYAVKLSHWDRRGNLKAVGFEPNHGNGWLYHYGWLNGGEFLSPDGRTCTLDDPRIVEALQFTTDIYDAMGGVAQVNAFKKSFQTYAQDPFFKNQIAMFIHGDWFLRDLSRYKRDMRFGTCPPPVPEKRLKAGFGSVTWIGGYAYCIPSTCPPENQQAAWWLVKFLSSIKGGMTLSEHDAQRERGQGRLYMPRIKANRKLNELQLNTYVRIPQMPERVRAALQTHIDMLDHARFRPVSPEGHKLWNAQADAQDLAWNHNATCAQTLRTQTEKVQRALDRFYAPPKGRPVNWGVLLALYFVLLAGLGVALYRRHTRLYPPRPSHKREWRAGVMFAAPWLVGFVVLSGGPMLFSAVLSFAQYDVISPARYVGQSNYHEMFTQDWSGVGGVQDALGNTLFMAIGLPLGMAVGLGLALLLNANVKGMSIYRTTFFLPAIMPVVAASVLWIWVFNAQNGLMNWMMDLSGINTVLTWFGVHTPISWLTNKNTSKWALIIMGLWGAGAGMIIWLAGLREIPKHLYEAAALDGAGALRRFAVVTLPLLSPYILFNLLMGLIQTFQIFTQAYIMTPNGSPERSTYFYVYKLFDECFSFFRLGYGAAMAWVLFVIVMVITLVNWYASKRWVHYAGE